MNKRLKTPVFFWLCAIILFSGCKKIDELTQFTMEYEQNVTIPSSSAVDLPFVVVTPEMSTNAESTFSNNDTKKELIEEIRLTQMTLTLEAPSEEDFSFLKSIEISIDADGLDEIVIANKSEIPDNIGNKLELDVINKDLKEYIKKEAFRLRITTTTDELLSSDHEVKVYSAFFVDAKVLGV